MEVNLRREMTISDGNWTALLDSSLSVGLWTVAVIGFVLPIFLKTLSRTRPEVAEQYRDTRD